MSPYLARFTERLSGGRYSHHTKRNFLLHATRFVTFHGPKVDYDRSDVLKFVDVLVRKGYKEQSIKAILTAVRAMFTANDLPWPLQPRDLHLGLPQEEPVAPIVDDADVVKLIRAVKDQPGFPRSLVALATVYGLRADEIVRVFASGCNGQFLEVQTSKLGRKRRHLIPPILRAALTFDKTPTNTWYLHSVFDRLMKAHVREPLPREGWHAIRRSVVTALYGAKVQGEVIEKFMGWRDTARRISVRYFKPNPLDVDREIYDAHPYLKEWV